LFISIGGGEPALELVKAILVAEFEGCLLGSIFEVPLMLLFDKVEDDENQSDRDQILNS